MERQWFDRSPYVNQSLFNPEWIYGVSDNFELHVDNFLVTAMVY